MSSAAKTMAAGAWVQAAEAALREAPADAPHRRLLIDCERHHARAHAPPPWKTVSVGGVVRRVNGDTVN